MMYQSLMVLANTLLFTATNGYILGETEGDSNFMRCWQNGNLMSYCPTGLSWSWNLSTTETWYENEAYYIKLNLTWSDSFRNTVVVKDSSSSLVNHVNIHSCKFSLGSVCIPFIGANGDSVSHTAVITSDDHGIFTSSVSLTEGSWNVIAHGRIYLNDTTNYPLEGQALSCDNSSSSAITTPWKLDFAIGLPHDVEPPLKTDTAETTSIAGWQIFVIVIVIMGALGAAYKFYKHYKNKERTLEKETAESQLKKALIFELGSLSVSFGLATFDWITDTIALISIQATDDLSQTLVIAYFGMVIMITMFYFYVLYSCIVDIIAVIGEYQNGLKDVIQVQPSESDRIANDGDRDDEDDAGLVKSGNINYEFSRVRRSITTEKVSFFMATIEDLPMFIFNAVLLFHYDVDSSAVLISFITNAIILGYKFSGIERLWYLLQLRTKIDSMISVVRLSRQISHTDLHISPDTKKRLYSIEQQLINNERVEDHDNNQIVVSSGN